MGIRQAHPTPTRGRQDQTMGNGWHAFTRQRVSMQNFPFTRFADFPRGTFNEAFDLDGATRARRTSDAQETQTSHAVDTKPEEQADREALEGRVQSASKSSRTPVESGRTHAARSWPPQRPAVRSRFALETRRFRNRAGECHRWPSRRSSRRIRRSQAHDGRGENDHDDGGGAHNDHAHESANAPHRETPTGHQTTRDGGAYRPKASADLAPTEPRQRSPKAAHTSKNAEK